MSKKHTIKPVSLAVGAAFVASMAVTPAVQADVNPFAVTVLSSGYMVAEKGTEGQCGGSKAVTEAECGANKAAKKASEGECGANKKPAEGECGANKAKPVQEAKCGEAKCGSNK
ncbi:MAG: hypothetical protein OQK54_05740 [Gammaproteobacteria bacterium]|nr:hypothetical protein [Gammaproteobacteria bacterium]